MKYKFEEKKIHFKSSDFRLNFTFKINFNPTSFIAKYYVQVTRYFIKSNI